VRIAALHVGQPAGRDLVRESCGVLPEHRDVWNLLDAHHGRSDRLSECGSAVPSVAVTSIIGIGAPPSAVGGLRLPQRYHEPTETHYDQ
jgi:hypothetical protein